MTSTLKWKMWLLSNFEHCEGSLTPVSCMLRDADSVKEDMCFPANAALLGQYIRQLWGDTVRLVKRGSQKQRENFYLNLKNKSPINAVHECVLNVNSFSTSKKGWLLVNHRETYLSFVHCVPWSFKNQIVTVEVQVEKEITLNSKRYYIASHGCQLDLKQFIDVDFLEKHPLEERVEMILTILETSPLCRGVQIKDDELSTPMHPHECGIYVDNTTTENRAFSAKCTIICTAGQQCCVECQKLKQNLKKRNKRKLENGGVIHPNTNKRHLSKEEITKQLHLQKQARLNAEKRQTYWREKFEG